MFPRGITEFLDIQYPEFNIAGIVFVVRVVEKCMGCSLEEGEKLGLRGVSRGVGVESPVDVAGPDIEGVVEVGGS